MGGIIIVVSIIFSILIFSNLSNIYIWYILYIVILYGIVGFIDDYLKVFSKKNVGLTAKHKYFWLSIIAIVLIFIMQIDFFNDIKNFFNISFFNKKEIISYNGIIFFILSYLIIVGFSNSVNLTDGLDGLAMFPVVMVCIGMGCLSFVTSNFCFSHYFKINYSYYAQELLIVCSSIIGSGIGFLWFNFYPAKVFMGDVGSLSLGGSIGLISILLNQEFLLIIMGGLFVIESLSVMIQVTYFKLRKKRIFLMTPIHHHYELIGYKEYEIVIKAWIISLMLLIVSLSIFFI